MLWILWVIIAVVLVGLYVWAILFARKRQRKFDQQYQAVKERHEIFVLHKKIVKERPPKGMFKRIPMKTYQVVGRIHVSQSVRGMQMSKMQQMTFQTTKGEFAKIQPNHRYKMDIAGNYIGYVAAPPPVKEKGKGKVKVTSKAADKSKSKTNNKKG